MKYVYISTRYFFFYINVYIKNIIKNMANQKQYSIVINGLKESIGEVDILLNQLDKLEKRLSNLGKQRNKD